MTRKSLAIGAAAALTVTGFAMPANAAGLADTSFVSLAPSAGTEYAVLAGVSKTFTLRANEASTLSTGNLSFLVEDSAKAVFPAATSTGVTYAALANAGTITGGDWSRTGGTVTVTLAAAVAHGVEVGEIIRLNAALPDSTTASNSVAAGYYTVTAQTNAGISFYDGLADNAAADATVAGALTQSNIVRAASGNFVVDSGVATSATNEDLLLAAMSTSAASATVTAWKDANANGTIDSTEYASPVRTVQFVASSGVTATVTTDPYIVGAAHTTATAYVTTTPALNGNFMSTGDLNVRFNHQGSATNTDIDAAFNTTTRKWSASSTLAGNIAAGTHSVTARIGSTAISSALTITVAAATAADGLTAVSESANVNTSVDGNDDVTATVRAKTLSVSATMSFVDADEAAVVAGRPVKVTVTTLTGATGVKVNGTSVAQGDVLDVVTDAKGQVVATVTATAANDGAVVKLTGVAEGVSGTSTFVQFSWADASYTLYDLNGTASLVRSIAKGGSYTFSFAALDQWAQNLSGDFRLKVAVSGNTVSETYPSFSAGSASVTVSDAQIADGGDITVVVTPQKKQTDGTWATTGAPNAVTYTLHPSVQTGAAVSATSADASVPVVTTALAAGDTRSTQATVSGAGTGGTDAVTVTGTVTNSVTAAARPGALITVSGDSSLLFVNGTKAAFGSLTFYADATTGNYSVNVRSNKAQTDSVVTVTSQGASKTIKVTFERALATAGATLTVDAPAYATPGSTMVVNVKLVDKFGNPVRNNDGTTLQANNGVTVTYTGPGLIVGSISNLTDANGLITFRVLLGTNDTGTASVTAVFANNSAGTTDDITVTKTVTIGAAPAAAKVNVGSFNGKLVVYANGYNGKKISWKVGGKWGTAVAASDTARFARVTPRKGVTVSVQIYVDGVLTLTKSVVTK